MEDQQVCFFLFQARQHLVCSDKYYVCIWSTFGNNPLHLTVVLIVIENLMFYSVGTVLYWAWIIRNPAGEIKIVVL